MLKRIRLEDYDPIFDKVLFCCNDCSFFVSAKEFSGCNKDHIFFFNDDRIFKMEDYDGGDISQFPKLC